MDHVTADRAAQTEQPGAHAAGQHQVTGQDGAYRKIMGIDIGGTGMKGGIVRVGDHPKSGQLKGDRFRIPTPQPALPESVSQTLESIAAELDSRKGAPSPDAAVGVCFPSIIQHGVCLSANNIDPSWIGTDVQGLFSDHLGRPVRVINDADAAGLAESRFGAGRGVAGSVLTITLGTGIGAAMVHDGILVPNFELGSLELDGVMAEKRASASAREREGLDWPAYAERLQRYFSYVERIFSPDLFIVGGGISKRPDDFLPLLNLRTPIVPAELRNNAGIVGAALYAAESNA
ncbi:polyphosphate glucokinase [Micrococcus terreus]|uniref:Polyphosphate glucokinase n=2 Tax=Micrococcaceae TaxID=1268 RepID=A0A1I7MKP4_9MICC|nr:polyphosphate glucokinase [Micrococcus terreus]